jgi:cytochrome P450
VRDTSIDGQEIKAGEGVFAVLQSANWDETMFPQPEKFDITRKPANHLGFGFGVHQCIGQNLAKAEMEVAFNKILDRLPTLRLAAPLADIPFKTDAMIYGVRSLPVTW